LALFIGDAAAAAAEFGDDVRLPQRVLKKVREARELREAVEREEAEMVTAQVAAVLQLRKLSLGHRDAGRLLGLSHQRVQQLEHYKVARPLVHGAILEADSRGRHILRRAAKKR
jgi:hypothetical protein